MEASAPELPLPRDLVVVGASAGGVETLKRLVRDLEPDLGAAVLVVLHLSPGSPSALPNILGRAGRLPCRSAGDGDELRAGEILVAPPDHHLVVEDGRVRLSLGPRENGHRPAVDVLFRSAAEERGARVVGVVLSGTRDDGTAGLAQIKARGGAAVVQDPADALYPGMPASAIAHVAVDAVVPTGQIAHTVAAIVKGETDPPDPTSWESQDAPPGDGLTSICPECGGVLSELEEAGVTQWECRVGHRFSAASLTDAQAKHVEMALWTAIRMLRDRALLLQRLADQCDRSGRPRAAARFRRKARDASEEAGIVLGALERASAGTLAEPEPDDEIAADAAG